MVITIIGTLIDPIPVHLYLGSSEKDQFFYFTRSTVNTISQMAKDQQPIQVFRSTQDQLRIREISKG
jgi:hypothetical protein